MMTLLRRQQGIGLLELMLAMAIGAVLILMSTKYYASSKRSELVQQGVNEVQQVLTASREFAFQAGGTMVLPKTADIANSGSLPAEYIQNAGTNSTITTPWAGASELLVNQKNKVVGKTSVSITSLPDYACNDLVYKLQGLQNVEEVQCKNNIFQLIVNQELGGIANKSTKPPQGS